MTEEHQNALGPKARQALGQLLAKTTLLAFDFDGTLAPIVAQPDQAALSASVVRSLTLLQRQHVVAIVTGRSVEDVRHRLKFEPDEVVGSHGAEDLMDVSREQYRLALDPVRMALVEPDLSIWQSKGIFLEDKGYSMAFHYRRALDRAQAKAMIMEFLRPIMSGLKLFEGKMVINLTAENAPDKADAVLSLCRRWNVPQVLYIGDDINDEPVFQRRLPDWLTVKVGRSHETTAAEYLINHQADVAVLLNMCRSLSTAPDR